MGGGWWLSIHRHLVECFNYVFTPSLSPFLIHVLQEVHTCHYGAVIWCPLICIFDSQCDLNDDE